MQIKGIIHILKHSKVLFYRPRVLFRAFIGVFMSVFFKKSMLRIVEFVINSECDSKCVMCYATNYESEGKKPLSAQEISSIWEQCEKLGAFIAVVEGGEPTLRPDFDEVIKALNPWKNIVVVVSNSLTLSREKLKHFKEIGISTMHLSLDGVSSEENDPVRGAKGHFDKVVNSIKICKEIGLEVYLSSMVTHTNTDKYEKIMQFASDFGIGVSGALAVNKGRFENRKEERLLEDDWVWVNRFLKKWGHIIRFDWNTNFSGKYECPAGREKISVSLYGEVMACVCNHLSFGDLRKETVKEVLDRMGEFSYFKEKNEKCLVGFDTEYRRKYMDTIDNASTLPVSIFEHPVHPAKLKHGKIIEQEDN